MAKSKKQIEYAQRLKELKKKLKPYRNKQTVPLLRVITRSSRVYLHKYWDSLESVLTGHYSPRVVQERIQNVANMITENGEYNNTIASHSNSMGHNMVMKEFEHLNFDSKANVSGNVTHVEIDSKANVLDDARHINIDSRANVFGNVTHVEVDSKANVLDDARHINIDSRANVFGNVTHVEVDSKANVLGDVRHFNIDSKANVSGNVTHVEVDSKANVRGSVTHGNINSNSNVVNNVRQGTIGVSNLNNRLKHLHIHSCNPACYER